MLRKRTKVARSQRVEAKALAIQSIYMLESSALSTILPLLMREEGLSVGQIGIVYSIEPILFQLTRLFLGALSDFVGRKPFFVLNGVGRALSFLGYYFAKSPIGFVAGRILMAFQGFLISAIGYPSLFCLSAIGSLIFSVLAHIRISIN
ncbi:MAG: hypothetical protein DRN90_01835 [Thermoproteota archaeon]|nr:MAG: hypothetical protein DRN90_01835 [Candidatus Korarchaeota archaeon]